MLSNIGHSDSVQERENDLQEAERLTAIIGALAGLGTEDQRRGRSRIGQFVAKPAAIEAQVPLEKRLLALAKRIEARG